MKRWFAALAIALGSCSSIPSPPSGTDADTAAWWAITGELSSDKMEGRDTGSLGHAEAARLVIEKLHKAGLEPAGDNGTWVQTIALEEARVEKEGTAFTLVPDPSERAVKQLRFLHEISVRATAQLPAKIDGFLAFRGYCGADAMQDVKGKVVVCFGARRAGMTTGGERLANAARAGAVGIINVDDPGFTIEPARWPDAYARAISFRGAAPPTFAETPVMRLSAAAFPELLAGSGRNAQAVLADGAASRPLASFDLPMRLEATFKVSRRQLLSENVLGMLPGTDPVLKNEIVVVSAHLDGYGHGEAVDGDGLYNGAFDDAAYVATLIRLAERRAGKGFRRSVLFAAWTGEEKGLLGSTWFTQNPSVPKERLAAVINLDQLRPLFPLKILTVNPWNDSSLTADAKAVAAEMGIETRQDMEPERNLNQRTDHFPFLRIGVPGVNFVFGYDAGTEAEERYREWYRSRYHRPQDDMGQPLDWGAARDMNLFFYKLTERVAEADARPAFLPGSPFRPR